MSDGFQNTDLRNRIGGFLFGYSSAAFVVFLLLVERWAHSAPTAPNPVNGRLYAHNEHGWITYFTEFQATSDTLMFWSCFLTTGLAIVIMPKQGVKVRRLGRVPVAASWKNNDEKGLAKTSAVYGALSTPVLFFLIGPIIVRWLNSHGIVLST